MADVRLIDANALLKECEKRQEQQTYEYCDCFLNDAQGISTEWWCVEDMVMAAPTIDAVPVVHARWVDNHCTACGMMPMGDEMWEHLDETPPRMEFFMSYCPCCGANMDAEEEPPC